MNLLTVLGLVAIAMGVVFLALGTDEVIKSVSALFVGAMGVAIGLSRARRGES